ncbi:hypothetical protein L798_04141 [Zootermopsis nevadensis]|uniref:Uncharacterized protein n=1 Tax=Zootermopsis nevadensis TaxID=136037 RepID=A0A067RC25_ZOONE|nr:hypothetical protein L798_04141 [Zootermopsis nevadensis]
MQNWPDGIQDKPQACSSTIIPGHQGKFLNFPQTRDPSGPSNGSLGFNNLLATIFFLLLLSREDMLR